MEVPLNVFRQHAYVSEDSRSLLLSQLLSKQISYPEYLSRLSKVTEIKEVITYVEKISKLKLSELRRKEPSSFCDEVLESFIGAKMTASGMRNDMYDRLVKHVNISLASESVSNDIQFLCFTKIEDINTFSMTAKMKMNKLVIVDLGNKEEMHEGKLINLYNFSYIGNFPI